MAVKDITNLQVCRAIQAFQSAMNSSTEQHPWPYELLAQETGQPEKVCWRALERAYRHNRQSNMG